MCGVLFKEIDGQSLLYLREEIFAQLLIDAQAKIIHRSWPIKMRRARIASKADSIASALAVFPARHGGAPKNLLRQQSKGNPG